jgi:hypothetical protein
VLVFHRELCRDTLGEKLYFLLIFVLFCLSLLNSAVCEIFSLCFLFSEREGGEGEKREGGNSFGRNFALIFMLWKWYFEVLCVDIEETKL